MSEVAGRLAPTVGAATLMRSAGGLGLLMSGVPGTRPARVTIIGGGVAGANAAIIAAGLGSDVTIFDTNIQRLRFLDDHFQGRIKTAASNPLDLDRAVVDSDLVIGSVLIPGAKAPKLVTNDMVSRMQPGQRARRHRRRPGRLLRGHAPDDARRSDIPGARQHLLLRRQHARRRAEHVDLGADERDAALHPADRAPRMEGRAASGCRPRRRAEHRRRHDREPGRRDRARAWTSRRWRPRWPERLARARSPGSDEPPSTERTYSAGSSGTSTSVSRLRLSPRKNGFDRGNANQRSISTTPNASAPMPSTKVPPMPSSTVYP